MSLVQFRPWHEILDGDSVDGASRLRAGGASSAPLVEPGVAHRRHSSWVYTCSLDAVGPARRRLFGPLPEHVAEAATDLELIASNGSRCPRVRTQRMTVSGTVLMAIARVGFPFDMLRMVAAIRYDSPAAMSKNAASGGRQNARPPP